MLHQIKKLKTELFVEVEQIVKNKKCSYMDAVLLFCETNNVDIDQAAGILLSDKAMVAKIKTEARSLNFLKE